MLSRTARDQGNAGFYQWPIRTENDGSLERIRLARLRRSTRPSRTCALADFSRDGSTLLAERTSATRLSFSTWPNRVCGELRQPDRDSLAPPSARTPSGRPLRVQAPRFAFWNAATGEHVCDLPTPSRCPDLLQPGRPLRDHQLRAGDSHLGRGNMEAATRDALHERCRLGDCLYARRPHAAVGVWGVGVMLHGRRYRQARGDAGPSGKPPPSTSISTSLPHGSAGCRLVDHAGCCVWDIRLRRQARRIGP